MENELPIIVFDVATPDGIYRALRGDSVGTVYRRSVAEPESRRERAR